MVLLSYIIWKPDPIIFSIGKFAITWYSLFILLAFIGGRQLIRYVYEQEKRPLEDADNFSTWVLCAALIGARLGEVLFYDLQNYLNHPWEAFLPITFDPHFKFTGYRGLSYHGAIIGSILGAYIYANYFIKLQLFPFQFKVIKQKKKGQNFLWLSTPMALGIMMGFLVRMGNFVNSEIIGTPTKSQYGVLFAENVAIHLQDSSGAIAQVALDKSSAITNPHQPYQPIRLTITFKNAGFQEETVKSFLENKIKQHLVADPRLQQYLYEDPTQPLNYTLSKTKKNAYVAHIETLGIPRHPVQLYESLAYLITLLLHLYWWRQKKGSLKEGVIMGSAMAVCYSLRFICEFFKEPFNVLFKGCVVLTTGHLLSFLTVLGGLLVLAYTQFIHKGSRQENTLHV